MRPALGFQDVLGSPLTVNAMALQLKYSGPLTPAALVIGQQLIRCRLTNVDTGSAAQVLSWLSRPLNNFLGSARPTKPHSREQCVTSGSCPGGNPRRCDGGSDELLALPGKASCSAAYDVPSPSFRFGELVAMIKSLESEIADLAPEIAEAAAVLARDDELDLRQQPGSKCGLLMTTLEEVLLIWLYRGIQHDLAETERQLIEARLGQDRWRQMHLVLTSNPTGSVYPLDFCPELSAEVKAFYKQENWFDFPEAPSLDTCNVLADMLALGPTGELFDRRNLKSVNVQLQYFAKKIATLEATRKALADALPMEWPGSTAAEWKAFYKPH
jgi:hypothetical protein